MLINTKIVNKRYIFDLLKMFIKYFKTKIKIIPKYPAAQEDIFLSLNNSPSETLSIDFKIMQNQT